MNLLQMSFTAGILIACIMIFRGLFIHRIPKKALILLWEIAILRLIFPFFIPMPFPGIGDLGAITVSGVRTETLGAVVVADVDGQVQLWGADTADGPEAVSGSEVSMAMDSTEEQGMTAVSVITARTDKGHILWLIYDLVTFFMAAGSVYLYFRDSQLLRESLPMPERERLLLLMFLEETDRERMGRVRFRMSDRTASPVTCGVFCPVIIFPRGLCQRTEKEITFWLRHELIHIRHHDNLKKVVAHGVLCVHWFNPMVWLLYFLFNRDMELACDEAVVRRRQESRKEYALALLSMAERRSPGFQTGLGFGKNAVTERITAVMKFRKVTWTGILGTVMAVALALTVFGSHYVSFAASSYTEVYPGDVQVAEYTVTMEDMGSSDTTYGVNVMWEDPDIIAGWRMASETEDTAVKVSDTVEEAVMVTEAVLGSAAESAMAADGENASEYTADTDSAVGDDTFGETGRMIEGIVAQYQVYGMSVEILGNDYQLYCDGVPIYFFADNTIPEEEGFSGRLLLRPSGGKNGVTGVVVLYDQDGKVSGLKRLSEEESAAYTKRWR